jgi:hypothetical protein
MHFDAEKYWQLKPIQRFWYRVRQIKNDFPAPKKLIVRTTTFGKLYLNGNRVYGCCRFSQKRDCFIIMIERNTDAGIMVDTLYHEWAHMLTWESGRHCTKFWRVYGKIFRRYLDEESR